MASNGLWHANREPAFVGRSRELGMLATAVADVRSGLPRVLLVEGESGIGKSRLVREIADHTADFRVVTGRCEENVQLPYLPFADALLPVLLDARESLGMSASDIAVISAMRDPPTSGAGPTDRSRQAWERRALRVVTDAVLRLADQRPLLLVIEDLQWADSASVSLLEHLSYALADAGRERRAQLAVAVTFRTPTPQDLRLQRTVGRLRREPTCVSLSLLGLSEGEITQLVRSQTDESIPQYVVRALEQACGGNPLLLLETARHMVEQGLLATLKQTPGRLIDPASLRLAPELASPVRARLASCSATCREMLVHAAVVGSGRFSLPLLARLLATEIDQVLDAIAEAHDRGFLIESDGSYRFAHALYQHECYSLPNPVQRSRLHVAIANELEDLSGGDPSDHATEIARHLLRADSVDPERIERAATAAAEQAESLAAWGEAALFYAAAAEYRLTSDAQRATLHTRAATAFDRDQDVEPHTDQWRLALDMWEQQPEPYQPTVLVNIAEALDGLSRAALSHGGRSEEQGIGAQLDQFLQNHPEAPAAATALVLADRSETYFRAGQGDLAEQYGLQALKAARRGEDPAIASRVAQSLGIARIQQVHEPEAIASFEEAIQHAEAAADPSRVIRATARLALVLASAGRLDDAEQAAGGVWRSAVDASEWIARSIAGCALGGIHATRGDFATVERYAGQVLTLIARTDYADSRDMIFPCLAYSRFTAGRFDEAKDALDLWIASYSGESEAMVRARRRLEAATWVMRRLFVGLAERDGIAEARAAIARDERHTQWRPPLVRGALPTLAATVELAALVGSHELAQHPRAVLNAALERGCLFTSPWPALTPRLIGVSAALAGDLQAAEEAFQQAITEGGRIGARAELARTHLDYALALEAASPTRRHAIDEQLARAQALFGELGMDHWIDVATAASQRLGLASPETPVGKYPDGLTAREVEVLQRVTDELTNDQIAEALVISPATARRHVANIYLKIDVSNRAGAARYCIEHGLRSEA